VGAGLGRRRPGGWIELASQLGDVSSRMAQAADEALALGGLESPGDLETLRRSMPRQTGDVLELAGQCFGRRGRRRLALRLQALEKEHRIGEQPAPHLTARRAPGGVQPGDLAAGEPVLGGGMGQAKAGVSITAHERHKILHRRVRRDLAGTQQILDVGR
jgi:hypothetical protein